MNTNTPSCETCVFLNASKICQATGTRLNIQDERFDGRACGPLGKLWHPRTVTPTQPAPQPPETKFDPATATFDDVFPLRFRESGLFTTPSGLCTPAPKPPLGVTPKWLHDSARLQTICEACQRFIAAKLDIPYFWVQELHALLGPPTPRPLQPPNALHAGKISSASFSRIETCQCTDCQHFDNAINIPPCLSCAANSNYVPHTPNVVDDGEDREQPRRGTERTSIPDTAGAAKATPINPVVDERSSSPDSSNAPRHPVISDDEILSLWRTTRPSAKQDDAMTFFTLTSTRPTCELRRLVELSIDYALHFKATCESCAKEDAQ